MFHLSLPLVAAVALLAPQEPDTVSRLQEGLADKDAAVRIRAIDEASKLGDPALVSGVAKLLGDADRAVAVAAANGLGRMPGKPPLEALHRAAKSPSAAKDLDLLTEVYRAIGRHGDPTSIQVLASKPADPADYRVIRARIFGLAEIRTKEAAEALLGLMTLDTRTRLEPAAFAEDLRTALFALTGVDQGPSKTLWAPWWRKHGKDLELPSGRPWLPEIHRLRWEGAMGRAYEAQLPKPTAPDTAGLDLDAARRALGGNDDLAKIRAVAFLGESRSEEALDLLHKAVATKSAAQDEVLFAALLTAIARHGQPSSVAVLANKPFEVPGFRAIRARIYGLANIRTPESIDALVGMSQLATPAPNEPFVFMDDLGTALQVLTGLEKGSSKIDWTQWWHAEKQSFRVSDDRPWLPKMDAMRWEDFWGEPYETTHARPELPGGAGMDLDAAQQALRSKDLATRLAAVSALARLPDPAALGALHRAANAKDVQSTPTLLAAVLRALGHRGDASSVAVLGDKPLSIVDYDVIRARLYGLANIRTKESVDALVAAMKLASPPPGEPFVYIDDLRTAFCVLTGQDHGPWPTAWDQWWRRERKSFELPAARPPIPPLLQVRWQDFWGEAYKP